MFGPIGLWELILIFVVALLLFGPRKLPDIGRTLGKALGEFRRASNDLKRSLEEEVAAEDLRAVRNEFQDVRSSISAVASGGLEPVRSEPTAPEPAPVPPEIGEAQAAPAHLEQAADGAETGTEPKGAAE